MHDFIKQKVWFPLFKWYGLKLYSSQYNQIDCCSQMSEGKQVKREKMKRKNRKKQQSGDENEVQVGKLFEGLQFPPQLSQINYLAISNLEASVEDEYTHQIYHQAIMENQDHFAGKTILHITEGINCLYSIFAARAGAKKVYCVISEKGDRQIKNIQMMREVVRENTLQGFIEVLLWKDFDAKVDLIIGQPMGYCLHFDGLLDRFIQARDKYLVKGGAIFPNILSFKCAAVHDEFFADQKIDYWDDIYGIPMKSMKKWISHEPLIRNVDPALIVSKTATILTFDLEQVTFEEIAKIDQKFQVDLLGPCSINGIVCWFEAYFDVGSAKKQIKASPWVESTKFTQVTLYWPYIVPYRTGGKLRIRMKGQKHENQGFTLMSTEVNGQLYQFSFS